MARIAVIGLGAMGGPMARNLIAGGHDVAIFDAARAAVDAFGDSDCRCATSAVDAASDAEFVITMLPTAADVRTALLEAGGACEALAEGSLIIDMSTVGAGDSVALAGDLAQRGYRMIDAPVGRGPLASPIRDLVDHGRRCGGGYRCRPTALRLHRRAGSFMSGPRGTA